MAKLLLRLSWGSLVYVSLVGGWALAQTKDDIELTVTEQLLRRPLATPFRSEGTLRDTTRPAYTIERQEIEAQGARTVREALRFLPGILPDGTVGTEVNALSGQFIRGSNSAQVLILLDGRPINNLGAGAFDLSELTTDIIERIEVLPGGGSTLYGSDAIGGIVNIITTSPEEGRVYRLTTELGNLGFNSQQFSLNTREGDFSLLLNYNRTQAQNNYFFSIADVSAFRVNNDTIYNNLGIKFNYEPTDRTKLSLSAFYLPKEQGVPGGVPIPEPQFGQGFFNSLTDNNRKYTDQILTDVSWQQQLGAGTDSLLTARIFADFLNTRFDNRTAFAETLSVDTAGRTVKSRRPQTQQRFETRQRSWGTQIQHRWQFAPNQTLTYGLDYRDVAVRNTTQNLATEEVRLGYDAGVSQGAIFAQYVVDVSPSMAVTAGLRQEFSSLAKGSVTTPAVGTKFGFGDTIVRANYVRNFRLPTISNLFSANPTFIGNPNLLPETGDSYDFGFDQKLGDIGLLRFTYYINNISNVVAFTRVIPPRDGISGTFTNIGFVRSTGVETSLNLQLAPNLFLQANYTNNNPIILDDANPAVIGKELRFAGADSLNLGLAFDDRKGTYVGLLMHSLSGYPTDNLNREFLNGYTTFDLRFRLPLGEGWQLTGGVENIFDQRFELFPGFPDAGRTYRLGLTASFL
ncbi:MAG: TonB-dependent receptor [Pseudanabaenaceae cyanobacterium SKYGB_i_bin29]|nr:TonB-dependent receptor [Pseudanabaenaceae cyanobacterium SKYG29]MDW8421365.1 TonB-dependent receptor [Pseudanabaenaceae cyanobacterium SKYGB_i_bin29]